MSFKHSWMLAIEQARPMSSLHGKEIYSLYYQCTDGKSCYDIKGCLRWARCKVGRGLGLTWNFEAHRRLGCVIEISQDQRQRTGSERKGKPQTTEVLFHKFQIPDKLPEDRKKDLDC